MKNLITVTHDELVKILMNVKHATPATFVAITNVKMNKTNNPYYDRVTKKQKSNVFINFDYTKSVNKALTKEHKEADFVAKPRKWGEKITGTPIISHKNEYYLEARFLNNEPKIEYILDNTDTIEKELFETYLPPTNNTTIKEHQGLNDEIIVRDFKISNILEIVLDGNHYIVKNN